MSRKRRIQRTPGDVIAIPLSSDGRVAFGIVLEEPLIAFLDRVEREGTFPDVSEIAASPVAFRIWVMNRPIIEGAWPIIGHISVPENLLDAPWFFKQDPLSGKVTITRSGAEEVSPKPGQADALERAVVWSAQHVVDRLRDHFDMRTNQWVEAIKLK